MTPLLEVRDFGVWGGGLIPPIKVPKSEYFKKNAILQRTTAGFTPPDTRRLKLRGLMSAHSDLQRHFIQFLFIALRFCTMRHFCVVAYLYTCASFNFDQQVTRAALTETLRYCAHVEKDHRSGPSKLQVRI